MLRWRNAGDPLRTSRKRRVLAEHVDQVPWLKSELLLIAVMLAIAFLVLYLRK